MPALSGGQRQAGSASVFDMNCTLLGKLDWTAQSSEWSASDVLLIVVGQDGQPALSRVADSTPFPTKVSAIQACPES